MYMHVSPEWAPTVIQAFLQRYAQVQATLHGLLTQQRYWRQSRHGDGDDEYAYEWQMVRLMVVWGFCNEVNM